MLTWIWNRLRAAERGAGRADRRALSRLARPPRGEIDEQAKRLRTLPADCQLRVLAQLPAWQREAMAESIRRGQR